MNTEQNVYTSEDSLRDTAEAYERYFEKLAILVKQIISETKNNDNNVRKKATRLMYGYARLISLDKELGKDLKLIELKKDNNIKKEE